MSGLRPLCALLLIACTVPATAAPPSYALQQRIAIGGTGGWDYLTIDSDARRLYIARADRVQVLDVDSGTLTGEIRPAEGVHGVALSSTLKRGYTSNGRGNSVTVFDPPSLNTIQVVSIPAQNPDAILYVAEAGRVLTFNGHSKDVTAIDASTLAVVGHLTLGSKPEFAQGDGMGKAFVNLEDEKGAIAVLDAKTLSLTATWPMPGCQEPSGLAIDRAHHRLFSACDNGVMAVTDSTNGRAVARVPIGKDPDAAGFDPELGVVFSSNGEGTLTVIHEDDPDHYSVAQTVTTQPSARTLAVDTKTHKIWLVAAKFGPRPAPTPSEPRPRAPILPDTFTVLVVGPGSAGAP
jgi:DNA-binding beta-propeller fold protein YncE